MEPLVLAAVALLGSVAVSAIPFVLLRVERALDRHITQQSPRGG